MQVDSPYKCLTIDMVRLLDCHLDRFPDSPISQAVIEWYNAEYTALEDIEPYEICPPCEPDGSAPENLEDVIDIIGGFVEGNSLRVARASIRIICRQALRNNRERTALPIE